MNFFYLGEIYTIYPEAYEAKIKDICLRSYDNNTSKYDVIHLGEVIEEVNNRFPKLRLNFLKPEDIIIFFDSYKKDRTKYIRVFIVAVVVLMGSIMGIMNFHADVNMAHSQFMMVNAITKDAKSYMPYFQIPYSIGLGVGMLLFFNHWFNKKINDEPSPLEIEIFNYQQELDQYLIISENQLDDVKPPL